MYKFYKILSWILTFPVKSPKIGGSSAPGLWFHVASVGEISSVKKLVEYAIEDGYHVLISVFTSSGYEYLKELFSDHKIVEIVQYPFDKPGFIETVYRLRNIRALIIAETELWPNLINLTKQYNKNLYLVNGRLSDRNYRKVKRLKKFFLPLLNSFSLIFPQSRKQSKRFLEIGVSQEKIVFIGNTKIGVRNDEEVMFEREEIGVKKNEFVVVFGSIRNGEEEIIGQVVKKLLKEGIGVIVAPRHQEEVESFIKFLRQAKVPFTFRTKSKYRSGKVFIIDTIGELRKFYRISDLCVVGGTFAPYGGHNILEPASFGKPVLFGPFISNIEDEAKAIIDFGAGKMVKDSQELYKTIMALYKDAQTLENMSKCAERFIKEFEKIPYKVYQKIMEDLRNAKVNKGF